MSEQTPPFADLTLAAFVDRLASDAPVPGGGSASAVAASLAAALVAMVAQLSKRLPYVQHAELHTVAEAAARALAAELLRLADADAAAYGAFAAASKLPRGTDAERMTRDAAKRAAAKVAAEVPLRCVEACLEVVKAAESLAGRCNVNASSDLAVSALLAEAAARGAAENVRVNLPSVGDGAWATQTEKKVNALISEIVATAKSCSTIVAIGGTRPPVDVSGLTIRHIDTNPG